MCIYTVQPATELEPLPPVQSWGDNLRMTNLMAKLEIEFGPQTSKPFSILARVRALRKRFSSHRPNFARGGGGASFVAGCTFRFTLQT